MLLAALLPAAGAVSTIARAVSISPAAVYIDARTRTGALTLYNDGARPEEIEIEFAFGYPRSDSAGNVTVHLVAEAPEHEPSLIPWISAFPRRIMLEPGQRQLVRLLVQPPPTARDGEYWARVLVKSHGGQPPVEQHRADGTTIQLDVETVVAVPVTYRQGAVTTGILIDRIHAVQVADTVGTTVDLSRRGNGAFLGRLSAELLAGDRIVQSAELHIGVYHSLRQVVRLPVPEGTQGPLSVRVLVDTRREDLPDRAILPAPAVARTVAVETP